MNKEKKLQIRNSTAEFLIFTRQSGENSIEVRVEDETVWLMQKLMAALFEVSIPTINEHLVNLYAQEEISKVSTIRNFRTVQKEGNRDVARNVEHYNLDASIAVGFRVNSTRATQFRQWAKRKFYQKITDIYAAAKNNTPVGWGEQLHREPQHCNVGVHGKAVHLQPTKTKNGTNIFCRLPYT